MRGHISNKLHKIFNPDGTWSGKWKTLKHSWRIVLSEQDPMTHKRKQTWISFKGNKTEAEKKLTDILHDKNIGTFVKPTKLTVADYLKMWLTEYVKTLAPSTYQGREQQVRKHIAPALGGVTLTDLKPTQLQKLYSDKLASGLSARTVRDLHGIIHAALHMAVKQGLVGRNVAEASTPPSFADPEMHTLDQDGLNIILEAARKTQYYSLWYTLLFSGARRSEILALRWQDINLADGQLSINRSIHHLRNGEIVYRPPKTARSRRVIDLPPSCVLVLRQHRDNTEALHGSLKDDDLVFSHVDGSPYLPDSISHAWMKHVRRCGFPGIRLHDARHSHASILIAAGVPVPVVTQRLGHSKTSTTVNIYAHALPGQQKAAAIKFDDLVMAHTEAKTETAR